MIKIDWNIFNIKFNNNPQEQFEFLAYCLFAYEFNIKSGIFRYRNHPGIETAPIDYNGKLIGFQAKFYSNNIADNKADIINSIKIAKKTYPLLSKILLYCNQDLTYNTKNVEKTPTYLSEIQDTAKTLGIDIVWRTSSNIEYMLTKEGNKYLAEFFFVNNNGIFNFINALSKRTENIFSTIQSTIYFCSKEIKIDRRNVLKSIQKCDDNEVSIIYGSGGVGKTAVLKDFYKLKGAHIPFFILKIPEILEFFSSSRIAAGWNISIQDFLKLHDNIPQKIFIIDSAEKIVDFATSEEIIDFIFNLINNKWTVLFTTRTGYLNDLQKLLIEHYNVKTKPIEIIPIKKTELYKIAQRNGFSLPNNEHIIELLCIPFYLYIYLQKYSILEKVSELEQFKKIMWQQQINGGDYSSTTSITFCELVKQKIKEKSYYISVRPEYQSDIQKLIKQEIIAYDSDNNAYYIVHDVYEEWALISIIQKQFNSVKYENFFSSIGNELPIRRAYRLWLAEELCSHINKLSPFISYVMSMQDNYWKNETLIAIMLSPYASTFFDTYSELLLIDNFNLLIQVSNLIMLACRQINYNEYTVKDTNLQFYLSSPIGKGWESIISFFYKNIDKFGYKDITTFLPILKDWCYYKHVGETTKNAALFSLHFFLQYYNLENRYSINDNQNLLLKIITLATAEIKAELSQILDDYLNIQNISQERYYYDCYKLCKEVLKKPIEHLEFIKNLPEYVIKMASIFWLKRHNVNLFYNNFHEIEDAFSISEDFSHVYLPPSAYQTPIYWLLQFKFTKTINFIIEFVNVTVELFAQNMPKEIEKINLTISPNQCVEQYICNGLWEIHRGTGSPVMPYLLQSIHMALEKYLLEKYNERIARRFEKILIYIISNSKSASLTAVITSIVLKFPDKLFKVARILFSSKRLLNYDYIRAKFEFKSKSLYSICFGLNQQIQIYQDERIKTCDENFRYKSLEDLMFYYQINKNETNTEDFNYRRKIIENILDSYYTKYDELSDYDKFFLARVDVRKQKLEEIQSKDNKKVYQLIPELSEELQEKNKKANNILDERNCKIELRFWAENKIKRKILPEFTKKYEDSPQIALDKFHEIINKYQSDEYPIDDLEILPYLASVFIIYYRHLLNNNDTEKCEEIIYQFAGQFLDPHYIIQISDGSEVSLIALPYLYSDSDYKNEIIKLLLLSLFNDEHIGNAGRFCDFAFNAIREFAVIDIMFVKHMLYYYLITHCIYESYINKIQKNLNHTINDFWKSFLETNEDIIDEALNSPVDNKNMNINNISDESLCNAILLINFNFIDEDYFDFINSILSRCFNYLYYEDKEHSQHQDFLLRLTFERNLASIILNLESSKLITIIETFKNIPIAFSSSSFLDTLILEEDAKEKYDNFWLFWNGIYAIVKDVYIHKRIDCKEVSNMLRSYMLAFPYWDNKAKNWKSLREREKIFYKKIISELGSYPDVFFSVAKILTDIGTPFQDDGIFWIKDIILQEPQIKSKRQENEILYYLETFMISILARKREEIKKNAEEKNAIIIILEFLIKHKKISGYLMQESIL